MTPPTICTVIAKNYLAHARTLCASFLEQHPEGRCHTLVIDSFEGCFDPRDEAFSVVTLGQLQIPDVTSLTFKYDVTELATAAKPYLFEYLLREFKLDKLLYLDPDILVTARLDGLFARLDSADYILTPHLDQDYPDKHGDPQLMSMLMTGAFNLGFLGLRNSAEGLRLIRWLQEKLHDYCLVDYSRGYFVDQKFFDVAITLFPNFHIERDTGYNMAPWNIHSRALSRAGCQWLCNGSPLYFYHFSNYKPTIPKRIAFYVDRYTLDERKDLAELYACYRERLYTNGYEKCSQWPYEFGCFGDGTPILKETRGRYLKTYMGSPGMENPFRSRLLMRWNQIYRLYRAFVNAKSCLKSRLHRLIKSRAAACR